VNIWFIHLLKRCTSHHWMAMIRFFWIYWHKRKVQSDSLDQLKNQMQCNLWILKRNELNNSMRTIRIFIQTCWKKSFHLISTKIYILEWLSTINERAFIPKMTRIGTHCIKWSQIFSSWIK
jgi:hypothetical protein